MKLTKKRERWAENRNKPPQFKGSKLAYNASAMTRYSNALNRLVNEMVKDYRSELKSLFNKVPPIITSDANTASQARILLNKLYERFNKRFRDQSKSIIERIFGQIDSFSNKNLNQSLKELSGGLAIKTPDIPAALKEAATAAIAENVSLIRSIPEQFHKQIEGAVMRSLMPGGNGLQDVTQAIRKYDGITKNRADFIARDQTRKITTVINTTRAQSAGVKKFQWIHTGGSAEPRPLHLELDGQIFSFNDLPVIDERTGETGLPGQLPNCSCTWRPIVDFDDL